MNTIQLISIFFEFVVVILSLTIAVKKKKTFAYGFALTFAIYVLYDLARLFSFSINETILSGLFFIATISMLISVWTIWKGKK